MKERKDQSPQIWLESEKKYSCVTVIQFGFLWWSSASHHPDIKQCNVICYRGSGPSNSKIIYLRLLLPLGRAPLAMLNSILKTPPDQSFPVESHRSLKPCKMTRQDSCFCLPVELFVSTNSSYLYCGNPYFWLKQICVIFPQLFSFSFNDPSQYCLSLTASHFFLTWLSVATYSHEHYIALLKLGCVKWFNNNKKSMCCVLLGAFCGLETACWPVENSNWINWLGFPVVFSAAFQEEPILKPVEGGSQIASSESNLSSQRCLTKFAGRIL